MQLETTFGIILCSNNGGKCPLRVRKQKYFLLHFLFLQKIPHKKASLFLAWNCFFKKRKNTKGFPKSTNFYAKIYLILWTSKMMLHNRSHLLLNPNWHEGGHFPPPCPFLTKFCQLNLYQKFPNFSGGEKWDQSG